MTFPVALKKDGKLEEAVKKFREAVAVERDADKKKWKCFAFEAGHMWTNEEKEALEGQNPPRPAYVWNFIRPCIKLLSGIVQQNPFRITAEPRVNVDVSQQLFADVLNEAVDFVDEKTGAQKEEFEAWHDGSICGAGYAGVDVAPDPKRPLEIVMSEFNAPFYEVRKDPASRRDDWKDAEYIFVEKWMHIEDFKIAYPDYAKEAEEILKRGSANILEVLDPADSAMSAPNSTIDGGILLDDPPSADYDRPLDVDFYKQKERQIRVVHMEYWQSFQRYYGMNPISGEIEEFPPEKLKNIKEKFPDFEYTKVWDKKIKWLDFTRDKILYDDDSPIPFDGFSIVPFYWSKDKSKHTVTHTGVVSDLIDPNKEVNKRWSQALDDLVSQGRGLLAEPDAFVDLRQAQASWNDPRMITWLSEGALNKNKLKDLEGRQFPQAAMEMEKLSQEAIRTISGINPNLLGDTQTKSESGVVIRLRIQQGLTLLADAFENFKKFKKELQKRKMAIIVKYMPDSQLIKILGGKDKYKIENGIIYDMKREGVAAPIRDFRDLKYDLKIEDAPGNLTKSMAELAIFMQMLKSGFPVNPETVIKRLDITASEKTDWLKFIEEGKKAQAKTQQMQVQAAMAKDKTDLMLKGAAIDEKEKADKQNFVINLAKLDQAERQFAKKMLADIISQGLTQAAQGPPGAPGSPGPGGPPQQGMQQGQSQIIGP